MSSVLPETKWFYNTKKSKCSREKENVAEINTPCKKKRRCYMLCTYITYKIGAFEGKPEIVTRTHDATLD